MDPTDESAAADASCSPDDLIVLFNSSCTDILDLVAPLTVFLYRFGTFFESFLPFAEDRVHFSKQFGQIAKHLRGSPAKASLLLKILSSSLKSKFLCQYTCQCHQNV